MKIFILVVVVLSLAHRGFSIEDNRRWVLATANGSLADPDWGTIDGRLPSLFLEDLRSPNTTIFASFPVSTRLGSTLLLPSATCAQFAIICYENVTVFRPMDRAKLPAKNCGPVRVHFQGLDGTNFTADVPVECSKDIKNGIMGFLGLEVAGRWLATERGVYLLFPQNATLSGEIGEEFRTQSEQLMKEQREFRQRRIADDRRQNAKARESQRQKKDKGAKAKKREL